VQMNGSAWVEGVRRALKRRACPSGLGRHASALFGGHLPPIMIARCNPSRRMMSRFFWRVRP
jgi:hypothetical protein